VRATCVRPIFIAAFLISASFGAFAQQTLVFTTDDDGIMQTRTIIAARHPLSWWTARDKSVMAKAGPGQSLPIHQEVTTLGKIAGHDIIQIITVLTYPEIHPQRKTLLVQVSPGHSLQQIYLLDDRNGAFAPAQAAKIYGSGPNAILASVDWENRLERAQGYWWFDSRGAHPVDLRPLLRAVGSAIPANAANRIPNDSNEVPWAGTLGDKELIIEIKEETGQPSCNACDWIGQVKAQFRLDHGKAIPTSVHFDPGP